jgi:DNA-binding response OmpR family regulator
MRILLVDDEQELVVTLAERLSIRGIEADWATSGEDALKLAETESYDLAVLDIKIPRISGINLKKELQKKNPYMKFIFMTGHGSEDDYKAGSAEAGAEYYLVKPIDIKTLIEKMNAAIRTEV